MNDGRTYLFAGGGTGGHLYPGIAVAHALRALEPSARIVFMTTDRPLDADLLGKEGFEQIAQPVRPVSMNPLRWPGFWWAWRASVRLAARVIAERDVATVLGLGGYAAGPPVVAAQQAGGRRTILNPDAIPGRANRYLARRVDAVFLQWDVSRRQFGEGVRCETVGCPIRETFRTADRARGVRHFGLDAQKSTLLVTGASQGARSVNEVLQLVWPEFSRRHADWQLLHLTGPRDEAATRAAYERAGVAANVLAFTHKMADALAAADVVVSRAGASTLAELIALGKPAVLLPYPYHRDRHQHANAAVLADAGAAILLEDHRDAARNRGPVLHALSELADDEARGRMAAAARQLGRAYAAEVVARWMLDDGNTSARA